MGRSKRNRKGKKRKRGLTYLKLRKTMEKFILTFDEVEMLRPIPSETMKRLLERGMLQPDYRGRNLIGYSLVYPGQV